MPPPGNCDIWGTVDFGRGLVRVRCTQMGEHDNHRCEVELTPPESTEAKHQNVFEGSKLGNPEHFDPREQRRV